MSVALPVTVLLIVVTECLSVV
uniref:Uncharacterized protein n=1 Tax=Rhizophora mucronata TaxID=61149 RepID=A0A2P2PCH7_RHIMU